MTTKAMQLTGSWQSVATGDCLIENRGEGAVLVTLQTSAPNANAPYHIVPRGQSYVKVGTGTVYAKASSTVLGTRIVYSD